MKAGIFSYVVTVKADETVRTDRSSENAPFCPEGHTGKVIDLIFAACFSKKRAL
jgi:hypothetical protein